MSALLLMMYISTGIYVATMCGLRWLARSALALAGGKLHTRIEVDTRDELRLLGESFNTMAASVTSMLEAHRVDEERLAATIETAMDAVVQIDAHGTIIGWNGQAERTFGWTQAEALGRTLEETVIPRQFRDAHHHGLARYLETHTAKVANRRIELQGLHRDGYEFPIELSVTAINNGGRQEFSGFIRDITKQKEAERLIWTHANFDMLTGLPNRHMFQDRLAQEAKKGRRSGQKTALLYIDLDRFKEVNDTLGHAAGDALLRSVARRVRDCVREGDTVARLGGDEFTVILPGLTDTQSAERVVKEILARLAEPFQLGEEIAHVTASVGVTVHPDDATEPEALLKHADQAMYAAKNAGRSRFSFFTWEMQAAAQDRVRLTGELRAALAVGQFRLLYQPIVDLTTGRIVKAEALVRWQHPTRGRVSPEGFIGLAEETGLIVELGDWIFREAAQQVARWSTLAEGGFEVSVNVSPVQLGKVAGDAYRGWLRALTELDLPRNAIAIEITEGVLVEADSGVAAKLRELRDAGVRIAIDDFGTGYASLSYLRRFHVDYLKIDRSFVANLEDERQCLAVTEAIVVLAHRLGLTVIAEGVETEAQRRLLIEAGCDLAQGYLFSRPVEADVFEALL